MTTYLERSSTPVAHDTPPPRRVPTWLVVFTVVVTLLAPQGVAWGEGEVAHVIFLLAISKSDYEEAMAIYELFVTFVRERSMSRLLSSDSFDSFKAVALDCLSRS